MTLVLCLLPLVTRAPLLDPDEGLHVAIVQEMARRGDDVTPTFLGEPFLDKPSPPCKKCDQASGAGLQYLRPGLARA